MDYQQIIDIAHKTFKIEIEELIHVSSKINQNFAQAAQAIFEAKGRLIVTGIGKSGNIAQKLVATFNSTGTPAIFMHAADALHGDLGILQKEDVVICISNSGNSPEIKVLIPFIKQRGNILIAITGKLNSYLAQSADFILDSAVNREACLNNLAPTSSTMAQLALGDALAVALMHLNNFTVEDFAKSHPGGALGKKLFLTLADIVQSNNKPFVDIQSDLSFVIDEITKKRQGAAVVLHQNTIVGIITDGDIRRMLQKNLNLTGFIAQDIMTKNPKTVSLGTLAVDALDLMQTNNISQLVVVNDNGDFAGIIHIHDLIKEGLID
jgi:arabinose-5-phosphate isomerase